MSDYETAIYVKVLQETAADGGDHKTYNLKHGNAQDEPSPVVCVNGITVSAGYTFDDGGDEDAASITFEVERAVDDAVTCDYVWKYTCSAEEDLSVYELDKTLNIKKAQDVNGRTMVVESFKKVSEWHGALVWSYVGVDFWKVICELVEGVGTTFSIERKSMSAPFDLLENLYPVKYPKYEEIPGVPGKTNVGLEVLRLTAGG